MRNATMLRLLGMPHVVVAGDVETGLPDRAYVLLAMLLLEFDGIASRDQLRTVLWEEAPADRAAANLRWLLSAIRRWQAAHGVALIVADRSTVRIARGLCADVAEIRSVSSVTDRATLESMLDAWRGELLSGLGADFGPQLRELIARHRAELTRRLIALLRGAAERIGGKDGERLLRRLIEGAPDDEGLVRSLLLHLAREDGPRAAEAEYKSHAVRLWDDFGVRPSRDTTALMAQLAPATAPDLAPQREPAETGGIPRIVLLPPVAPVAVSAQTSGLAAALVEDVSLQLCRMRTFAMFAPHTARQIDGFDPVAAVAPFEVGYVAMTRLLPAADGGTRLALSVVQTATNGIVFADQIPFDETRLGIHFADLAEAIADSVATAVERAEVSAYRRTGAASAYVQYLLGTRAFDNSDLRRLRRARHHFARALELEPEYVPALTGIARTLSKESLALRLTEDDLARRAMTLADRAVEIDPLDHDGWREKALASLYLKDLDASLAYLKRAEQRAPHHADIIAEKADVLIHSSRLNEGKREILRAMHLNPLAPDEYLWTLGSAEFLLGRYEPALAALRRMRRIEGAALLVAGSAAMAGDLVTAARYRRRWHRSHPGSTLGSIASFIPHANRVDIEHFLEALRRAGFPE